MAVNESGTRVQDKVTAELVDCTPPPAPEPQPIPLVHDAATPTDQAAQATLAQTGADPPPQGSRC